MRGGGAYNTLMDKLKRFYQNFLKIQDYMELRGISSIAAGTAVWFFLSLVPMVILAVSLLPYTPLTEAQLLEYLSLVIPSSVRELIAVIVADVYRSSLAILSVSIVVTLWSAARGFSSLLRGLEEIYKQERRSGFLTLRALGVLYTLGMILFISLSILLGGFGRQLIALVERVLPGLHGFFSFLLQFRFLLVIAVLTVFFTMIYVRGSGRRLPVREVFAGALFAAVGWSFFTWAFSAWVSGSRFGTYGSLATVVIVMLWMYYCQYTLLLGACINRAIPRNRLSLRRKKSTE